MGVWPDVRGRLMMKGDVRELQETPLASAGCSRTVCGVEGQAFVCTVYHSTIEDAGCYTLENSFDSSVQSVLAGKQRSSFRLLK